MKLLIGLLFLLPTLSMASEFACLNLSGEFENPKTNELVTIHQEGCNSTKITIQAKGEDLMIYDLQMDELEHVIPGYDYALYTASIDSKQFSLVIFEKYANPTTGEVTKIVHTLATLSLDSMGNLIRSEENPGADPLISPQTLFVRSKK